MCQTLCDSLSPFFSLAHENLKLIHRNTMTQLTAAAAVNDRKHSEQQQPELKAVVS